MGYSDYPDIRIHRVADRRFGCSSGMFLLLAKPHATDICLVVELLQNGLHSVLRVFSICWGHSYACQLEGLNSVTSTRRILTLRLEQYRHR